MAWEWSGAQADQDEAIDHGTPIFPRKLRYSLNLSQRVDDKDCQIQMTYAWTLHLLQLRVVLRGKKDGTVPSWIHGRILLDRPISTPEKNNLCLSTKESSVWASQMEHKYSTVIIDMCMRTCVCVCACANVVHTYAVCLCSAWLPTCAVYVYIGTYTKYCILMHYIYNCTCTYPDSSLWLCVCFLTSGVLVSCFLSRAAVWCKGKVRSWPIRHVASG